MAFDIIIRGGRILDGTGNPWFPGEIGIKDGRIAAVVHRLGEAEAGRVIDAAGLVVAPGFIDTHSHSDLFLFTEPELKPKLCQGITTEIIGQDGVSAAPVRPGHIDRWRSYIAGLDGDPAIDWRWSGLGEYLTAVERAKPGTNIGALVPHGNIRQWVMGLENRPPSRGEIDRMKGLIAESMEAGALGMSIGLIYLPSLFAAKEELIEQFRVVARYAGIMVIHLRNEADYWLEAIDEALAIAEEAGVGLLISHFKAVGRQNWQKITMALERLELARERGIDVAFDQYPYTAGSTLLSAILPPWAVEGGTAPMLERLADPESRERIKREIKSGLPPEAGGWDNIARCAGWEGIQITSVATEANRWAEGRSLADIAAARSVSPADAAFDLLLEEEGAVGMIDFIASEGCILEAMSSDLQMVCTDGLLVGSRPHPRSYGAFPRVLGKYVREEQVLTLPQAVRHMTAMPARRLGLTDRGLIREGMLADLTLFEPNTVADRATYMEPRQFPAGIPFVLVNGQVAVEQGETTGLRAGRVIRRGGERR